MKLIVIKAEMSDDEINEVVPSGTVTVEITSHHGSVFLNGAELFYVVDEESLSTNEKIRRAFIEMLRLDK